MKVKCISIYIESAKEYRNTSSFLTIGKEYVVFEMQVYPGRFVSYRLACDDDKSPALFKSSQFEIVSGKISSSWLIDQDEYSLTFSPKAWKEQGFWEKVFDQDEDALEIYKREARKMVEEEQ